MSKPEISKFNLVMAQFHLKYHYSSIWNEEEIKQWNYISFELQNALRGCKPEKYEAELNRILKKKLKPLAVRVGVRYVRENKISEGIENLKHIIFEDPNRPVEILQMDDNTLQITEKKTEEKKEETPKAE